MMDAEFRSEEKFSKLSIAYEGKEEGKLVCSTVDKIVSKYDKKPETYTCTISNNREILVIEYQDDDARESGAIFEEIIKALNIKKCDWRLKNNNSILFKFWYTDTIKIKEL